MHVEKANGRSVDERTGGAVRVTPRMGAAPSRGARAFVCACTLAMAAGCARPHCDNQAFYGLPSPDGRNIAFIFHRKCPAPEGVSTQVSLMPFHDSLRGEPGNVLSAAGEQPVMVSWHGPRSLWVTGYRSATFRREAPLDGIDIEFHPAAADGTR